MYLYACVRTHFIPALKLHIVVLAATILQVAKLQQIQQVLAEREKVGASTDNCSASHKPSCVVLGMCPAMLWNVNHCCSTVINKAIVRA